MNEPNQKGIEVPVKADSVEAPVIIYNSDLVALDFLADDEETWWRVTFENLDSIKISRGEFAPFSTEPPHDQPYQWVSVVENSTWLKERYEYEKSRYGDQYEWGANVEEMLHEFDHYVFEFHDEFVEVIARGIWFDLVEGWKTEHHPLADLSDTANIEKREAHEIVYQIRTNPKSTEELIDDAGLCSQTLMQFAAELDGTASASWSVTLRSRNGKIVSSLRNYFGVAEKTYEGVASIDQVLPHIEKWVSEVKQRRREMGKD